MDKLKKIPSQWGGLGHLQLFNLIGLGSDFAPSNIWTLDQLYAHVYSCMPIVGNSINTLPAVNEFGKWF